MKIYTVELTTPKLEHVVTIDVEAGSFGGAEREARKLYDWAKPVTVKAVRLNEDPTADYDSKLQYIPLTGEQKSLLTCYILMTTKYREGERDAWESLSQEVDEQGRPSYPNASSNYKFWADLGGRLEEIRTIMDNI